MANAQTLLKEAQALKARWHTRDEIVRDNLDLILMNDQNQRSGVPSMVTNDPATLLWLAVAILSGGEPDDRVEIGGQDESVLAQGGISERLLKRFWVQRDRDALTDGEETWLRSFAFWAAVSGFYYTSGYLITDSVTGEARPISDVWSPLECYHEPGSEGRGPRRFVRIYQTTLEDAQDKAEAYGGTMPTGQSGSNVTVTNYWWRNKDGVYNAVLCEGTGISPTFLKPETRFDGTRIPIYAGPIAGSPERGNYGSYGYIAGGALAPGQTILDTNRPIYKALNELLSNYLEVAKDYASAPWLVKGLGLHVEPDELGKSGSEPDGAGKGGTDRSLRGRVYETPNTQANMQRVDPGRPPTELRDFIQVLEGMAQRGGLPYLLFAQAGGDLSGFAISQLITAAKHKLDPYMKRMSFVRSVVGQDWLETFRDGEFTSALVPKSRATRGVGLAEEVKPADVPKRFMVTSTVLPDLPSDRAERVNLARTVYPQGPLLSLRTTQDELLQGIVDDPDLEARFLRSDRVAANPFIQMTEAVAETRRKAAVERKRNNSEGADLLEQVADFIMSNLAQAIAAAGGGSAPASRTMMSPGTLPPEAQGISPDTIRAAIGRAPNTPVNLEGNR